MSATVRREVTLYVYNLASNRVATAEEIAAMNQGLDKIVE
jgi:hypothetical protein